MAGPVLATLVSRDRWKPEKGVWRWRLEEKRAEWSSWASWVREGEGSGEGG